MSYTHLTNFFPGPELINEIIQLFSQPSMPNSIYIQRFRSFRFEIRKTDYDAIKDLPLNSQIEYLQSLLNSQHNERENF